MIRVRLAVVSVFSIVVVSSGAVLSGAAADTTDVLALSADGAVGTVVQGVGPLKVKGDTAVDIDVVSVDGGQVSLVAGPGALPSAMRFPAYDGVGTYPRAVLSLTPTSGGALSPGARDFAFGGLYKLDATSSGPMGDNGDNLFQRGLWSEDSQFKLQVDGGHPSCVMRGSLGQVSVTSPTQVRPNEWYRTSCSRVGSRLTVSVTPYDGSTGTVRTESTGEIGTLSFPASRAATVGGKVSVSGALLENASDQFNGAVARVWSNAS